MLVQKMNSKQIVLFVVLILLASCKGIKRIAQREYHTDHKNHILSKKKFFKILEDKNDLDYQTLSSKVILNYNDNSKQLKATMSLRIEKDKRIWISVKYLGFTVAKLLATPDNVKVYEKVKRQYFDGDYSYFKENYGIDLNYIMLQNLLTGIQVPTHLTSKQTAWTKEKDAHRDFYMVDYLEKGQYHWIGEFSIDHLTLDRQKIIYPELVSNSNKENHCQIDYINRQQIENTLELPLNVKLELNQEKKESKHLELFYKNIIVNQKLNFPFSIPQGYSEL